ncbi:S8 family serine peptidase [Pseudolysinimonas sp.]|uniref:S8 family serine peptidase n=1 Tax=Pseudolysinimonas sp. TaxID=2680009 RepID=UPI003F7CDD4A
MRRLVVAGAVVLLLLAPGVAAAAPVHAVPAAPTARTDLVRSKEYWLDSYGIRSAWATTQGQGVTVAVIDTGIDGTVPELRGAVTDGTDFSGLGSRNGQTPVGSGEGADHGTMVASLLAGRGTGSGNGVIGVAPQASLLSISIGFGDQAPNSDDQIASAVTWAVDHGAKVINMSLTRNTLTWPPSWDRAFQYAMDHDVVVVAAAGNRGSGTEEVGAPATMPGVLTVAGVDASGNASQDASSQGVTIGVSAPSVDLVGVVPGGGYVLWDGTSGAAPIVAGVVALVRAAHPDLDADNVIQRIIATARDRGAPGDDPIYGYGLLDAKAAVTADVPPVTTNPLGSLADWVKLHRQATASPAPQAGPQRTAAAPAPGMRDPVGVLLPSLTTLRLVGIPALIVLLVLFTAGGLVVGIVRYFAGRSSR